MSRITEFVKSHLKIVIGVAAILLFALSAMITILIVRPKDTADTKEITSDESVDDGEAETVSDEESAPAESEAKSEERETEKAWEQDPEVSYVDLSTNDFVCVPFDEMHLRSDAGSDPKDDIAVMKAGDMVHWDGASQTVKGNVYYHVELSDGTVGYALADCLVPVYFKDDESRLSVIETDNALYTYEMMVKDIGTLTGKYPRILSKETIGKSVDGRDLYCLYLGNKVAPHKVFIQSSIHGREYMNTQLVMRLVEYYCANYENGDICSRSYSDLLNRVCFVIVPMVNPDGITIVQSGLDALNDPALRENPKAGYEADAEYMTLAVDEFGDSYWMDHYRDETYDRAFYPPDVITFEDYLKQWKSNANGVDLNNNFDGNWEEVDVKEHISYGSHKGTKPESEPEAKAIADLARKDDYDMYISYHSKGEIVYYDTNGCSPAASQQSYDLANLACRQLKYMSVSNRTAANVNQGGFTDWVLLELNKPAITIESGRHRCPLKIEEFKPMWLRHRELWAVLANDLVNGELSNEASVQSADPVESEPAYDPNPVEKKLPVHAVSATSELRATSKDGATYYARNVNDGDYSTAWVEGVPGAGEGQMISIELDGVHDISKVVIYAGYTKTPYRYTINGKPTRVGLDFQDGTKLESDVELYAPGNGDEPITNPPATVIKPDEPVRSQYVNITIMSAVGGTKYEDTAISEIEVYGY